MRKWAWFGSALLFLVSFIASGESGEASPEDSQKPFYLTIEVPPAPELSPTDALAAFSLAPGYQIELVAAEPLVEDPVVLVWDEDGRLYVAEMRGFMPDSYGHGQTEPVGAVVRLTDTDADGRMDRREVMADNLVLPRALAIVNEGLLIGEPPNLWLCPSATGLAKDIDCSNKTRVSNYGDQPGSVEHAENGLLPGLDNWLYNAKSERRLRLRGNQLEVEKTLFRGQWGLAQDDDGRLFYNTNSNLLSGDFYSAEGVIAAGNAGAAGLNERVHVNDEVFSVRVNPGVNRAYVPGVLRPDGRLKRPTSASGMTVYRGTQFPLENRGDVFVTEPAANVVVQLRLALQGLSISSEHLLYDDAKWGQREFLASTDERFRPVDVTVGPDGALYVVDMYRGIIQDHVFITEELRAQADQRELDKPLGLGRIWRVTHSSQPIEKTPPELSAASTDSLVALLGHDNAWHRMTAQRLLIERRESDLAAKLTRLVGGAESIAAVHALWTLEGRGELDYATVQIALASPQDVVARHGLRAGQTLMDANGLLAQIKQETEQQIDHRDVAFAQQLTLALGAHNLDERIRTALVGIVQQNWSDPFRRAAVQASVRGVEFEFLKQLQKAGWTAEQEAGAGFVAALSRQAFRNAPDTMTAMLDWLLAQPETNRWLQQAALSGFAAATREGSFTRLVLHEPHKLFASQDELLWAAVAKARRAFTWPGDDLAEESKPLSPVQREGMHKGADVYASSCANCHGADGNGIGGLGPQLAASSWVTGPAERLLGIVLLGLSGPIEVAGKSWDSVMPGHADYPGFSDDVVAGLMTYLHRSWGHTGRAVDAQFVATMRSQFAARNTLWTVPELLNFSVNTHYERYAGKFGVPGFMLQFSYDGVANLTIQSAIFNGPLQQLQEDQFLYEDRDLRLEFIVDQNGSIPAVRILDGSDGRILRRVAEPNVMTSG